MNLQGRVLSIGMQRDDVRLLQSELRRLALDAPDNEFQEAVFEQGTRDAVVRFQEEHRLEPTGVIDAEVGVCPTSSAVPYYSGGISRLCSDYHSVRMLVSGFGLRFEP
jgi:peptidoglycan hydrolase-like protein with peptidoglycan-binding domain